MAGPLNRRDEENRRSGSNRVRRGGNRSGKRPPSSLQSGIDRAFADFKVFDSDRPSLVSQLKQPFQKRSDSPVQGAARRLVSARGRGEVRDDAADTDLLSGPGIARTDENAVEQKTQGFSSISASAVGLPGVGVPNFADKRTAEAANRFFSGRTLGGSKTSKIPTKFANQDPTRTAFQNQFFKSQTLADVGIGRDKTRRF
jgi:hypothetical protein